MLLIDGVKYELWSPPSEDEFESAVKEHVNEIFGEQCIYLDKKQKLKSLSGIGSIPDGLAIILGAQPELHIVEYELSNHDVYEHVVSQVSKFINGLLHSNTRKKIAKIIYDEITGDRLLKTRVEQALHSSEIFKFSTELLESKPVLTVIIEKVTEELREALKPFSYQNIKDMKIVEFQTFVCRDDTTRRAHLFEPLARNTVSSTMPRNELLWKIYEHMVITAPSLKLSKPAKHYCKVAIGHRNIHLEWLVWSGTKLGVELHLESSNPTRNKMIFDELVKKKTELLKTIGDATFERNWGKKWSRIYVTRNTDNEESLVQWAIEFMTRFHRAFKPLIDEVDKL